MKNPLADITIPQVPPSEILRINLDLNTWVNPWNASDIEHASLLPVYKYIFVHWGGGPNQAGELIEEPLLTRPEKLAVQAGKVRSVLRSWEEYHVRTRGWKAIAYCYAIDPLFGKLYRLRGFRQNGGQYGHWNAEGIAVVFVLGYGQTPSGAAWKTLGQLWLETGAPAVVPHRYTNFDTPPSAQTTCPGDVISADIKAERYIASLGLLRHRPAGMSSKGRVVRSVTKCLRDLGYLTKTYGTYTAAVRDAVKKFQGEHSCGVSGEMGPETYKALAVAMGKLLK